MNSYCIIGRGIVSCAGLTPQSVADRVKSRFTDSLDPESSLVQHSGSITRTDVRSMIESSWSRRLDTVSLLACAAIKSALTEAKSPQVGLPDRTGIVLGSETAGLAMSLEYTTQLRDLGSELASPMLFTNTVLNAPASHAAILMGITGANLSVFAKDTAASQAISSGMKLIDWDRVDYIVAGGVDVRHPGIADHIESDGAAILVITRRDKLKRDMSVHATIRSLEYEECGMEEPIMNRIGIMLVQTLKEAGVSPNRNDLMLLSFPENTSIRCASLIDDLASITGINRARISAIRSILGGGSYTGAMQIVVASTLLGQSIGEDTVVQRVLTIDLSRTGACCIAVIEK